MDTQAQAKLWTKKYIIMVIFNFLTGMNYYSIMSIIPRYTINVFHLSESQAGVAAGVFIVGILSSRIFAGKFVTVIGHKKMQILGFCLMVIVTTFYLFADSPALLIIVRFLNGAAFGITANTNVTIVSSIVPRERAGEGMGYYSMFQMIAMAIGPFFGLLLSGEENYNAVFIFSTILPAAAFILLPFLNWDELKVPVVKNDAIDSVKQVENSEKLKPIDNFIERKVLPISLFMFSVIIAYSTLLPFMSVYAEKKDLTETANYFFIVYAAAILVTRPFVSRLFDKKGPNVVLTPAIILISLAFVLLIRANSPFTLLMSAVVFGVGFGGLQTSTLALVVHRATKDRMGIANATYYMSLDLSSSLAPMIGGALILALGYDKYYTIAAIWTLLCLPFYYLLIGRKYFKKNKEAN